MCGGVGGEEYLSYNWASHEAGDVNAGLSNCFHSYYNDVGANTNATCECPKATNEADCGENSKCKWLTYTNAIETVSYCVDEDKPECSITSNEEEVRAWCYEEGGEEHLDSNWAYSTSVSVESALHNCFYSYYNDDGPMKNATCECPKATNEADCGVNYLRCEWSDGKCLDI